MITKVEMESFPASHMEMVQGFGNSFMLDVVFGTVVITVQTLFIQHLRGRFIVFVLYKIDLLNGNHYPSQPKLELV